MHIKDDTLPPRRVHESAMDWARALEKGGYVGLPANAVVLGGLGADISQRLELQSGMLSPLINTLREFFDDGGEITRYGLYRCGLYLFENGSRMQKGRPPIPLNRIGSVKDRMLLVRVLNVLPGALTPYGRRIWTLVVLVANSRLAGGELRMEMPERAVMSLMRDISGLLTASEGYVEYLTGMWIKVSLGTRPPGRGVCVITSSKMSSVLNTERIVARRECPLSPCHVCEKTLSECRWSIKPEADSRSP